MSGWGGSGIERRELIGHLAAIRKFKYKARSSHSKWIDGERMQNRQRAAQTRKDNA